MPCLPTPQAACSVMAFWGDLHIWVVGLAVIILGCVWQAGACRIVARSECNSRAGNNDDATDKNKGISPNTYTDLRPSATTVNTMGMASAARCTLYRTVSCVASATVFRHDDNS
jgi:hypothetical protein